MDISILVLEVVISFITVEADDATDEIDEETVALTVTPTAVLLLLLVDEAVTVTVDDGEEVMVDETVAEEGDDDAEIVGVALGEGVIAGGNGSDSYPTR